MADEPNRKENGQFAPKDESPEQQPAAEPTNVTGRDMNYDPGPALGIVQRQAVAARNEEIAREQAAAAQQEEADDAGPFGVEAGTPLNIGGQIVSPQQLVEDGVSRGTMIGVAFGVAMGALLTYAVIRPGQPVKPNTEANNQGQS